MDLFSYPQTAGYKRTGTSEAAARSVPTARLRQLCLDQLQLYGPLTPDEAASNLGLSILSIRPRFSELANLGRITATEQRRSNRSGRSAIVWQLVP